MNNFQWIKCCSEVFFLMSLLVVYITTLGTGSCNIGCYSALLSYLLFQSCIFSLTLLVDDKDIDVQQWYNVSFLVNFRIPVELYIQEIWGVKNQSRSAAAIEIHKAKWHKYDVITNQPISQFIRQRFSLLQTLKQWVTWNSIVLFLFKIRITSIILNIK